MVFLPDGLPSFWMRSVKITFVGSEGELEINYDNPDLHDNSQKGVDCYFNVTISDTQDANKCNIEIHNLTAEMREKITPDMEIRLFAGYKFGEFKEIYLGSTSIVYSVESGTDVCTYVQCIDRSSTIINTHFQQTTYKKGTTFVKIVREQIKKGDLKIGDIEDPNEIYGVDIFRLEKDETKTQTPWNVIGDIVNKTNGIIHAGKDRTTFEREWKKKRDDGKFVDVSWTFYVNVKNGMSFGNFVSREWIDSSNRMIVIDKNSGLLEVHPNDYIDFSKGWTVKCLLNPNVTIGSLVRVKPEFNWDPLTLRVREYTHEHADGSTYYTILKTDPSEG